MKAFICSLDVTAAYWLKASQHTPESANHPLTISVDPIRKFSAASRHVRASFLYSLPVFVLWQRVLKVHVILERV